MNKLRSVCSRNRLVLNVLALVFVLATLAVPAAADDFEVIECSNGCIAWNAQTGCTYCQRCCVEGEAYRCWQIGNSLCS